MTSRPESDEDVRATPGPGAEPVVDDEGTVDERLVTAHDVARAALSEITSGDSVGDPVGYWIEPDGIVSLRFENRMPGYPGWYWTVSVARVEDADPTVLEVELLPGDSALLAPEWVPWAVRLAEYHAQQQALADASVVLADEDGTDLDLSVIDDTDLEDEDLDDEDLDDEDLDDEDLDEVEDLDAADFTPAGSSLLHSGDVDGVDIDELAEDDDFDEDDQFEDDLDGTVSSDPEEEQMSDQGLPGVNSAPAGIDIPGGDALLGGHVGDADLVSDEDDLGEDELQDDDGDDSLGGDAFTRENR